MIEYILFFFWSSSYLQGTISYHNDDDYLQFNEMIWGSLYFIDDNEELVIPLILIEQSENEIYFNRLYRLNYIEQQLQTNFYVFFNNEIDNWGFWIRILDDYWRGFEVGRFFNEHLNSHRLEQLFIGKKYTLQDQYKLGQIDNGQYIKLFLARCKVYKGAIMIADLEKMLTFIGVLVSLKEELKKCLTNNNFK